MQARRDEASRIAGEINSMDGQLEVAVEQFNQARVKLESTRQRLAEAKTNLAKAQAELEHHQTLFNRRMAGIYKSGQTLGALELVLSSKSLGEFLNGVESLKALSKHDSKQVKQIRTYRLAVERANRTLAEEEQRQTQTVRALEGKKTDVQRRLADRQAFLDKLKRDIAQAEAQAEAAQAAAARQAAARLVPVKSLPVPTINVPASGVGGQVVKLALAQLGKPYVWAAAGPNSFDCSGLTMFVYARVGIRLPHSAEAQYNRGRKISRDQLQPGDLIYGATGGYISHVGIYIGGDSYVTAPQTGDVVKISRLSARRNYAGATRPY